MYCLMAQVLAIYFALGDMHTTESMTCIDQVSYCIRIWHTLYVLYIYIYKIWHDMTMSRDFFRRLDSNMGNQQNTGHCSQELQAKGFNVPNFPADPQTEQVGPVGFSDVLGSCWWMLVASSYCLGERIVICMFRVAYVQMKPHDQAACVWQHLKSIRSVPREDPWRDGAKGQNSLTLWEYRRIFWDSLGGAG